MPTLPRKQRTRKWHKRERRPSGKQAQIYQRSKWTKFSERFRYDNPLCEACNAIGEATDVTPGERKGVTDHVIRASEGGAWYDERNLMALCKVHHDRKSSMEGKGLFDWLEGMQNQYGYLVPTSAEKKKAIDTLIGSTKVKEFNGDEQAR